MNRIQILNKEEIQKIINDYKEWEIPNHSPYILFCARNNGITITIYKSNKVMWQGKKIASKSQSQKFQNHNELTTVSAIGSDEVGVGDYFGPLVACACFISQADIATFKKLGVKDSKLLNKDQIMKLGPILIKQTKFAVALLKNIEYNNLISERWNSHELKTLLHIRAINKLVDQKLNQDLIIIDKYSSIKMLNQYIEKVTTITKIYFKPKSLMYIEKAESKHLSVAAASIIARYYFVNLMNDISKKLGITIPLGAGAKVDTVATIIKEKYGIKTLKNNVKWHFANSKRV